MAKHTLYLVTYDRGNHPITDKVMPYHWSYFIQIDVGVHKNSGIAHQLHGMPGAFHYGGPEHVHLCNSGPIKEKLEIGEVDDSGLNRVHEILSGVRIEKNESSGWNCQNWALSGLEMLKEDGFIYTYLTPDAVKNWLKEA